MPKYTMPLAPPPVESNKSILGPSIFPAPLAQPVPASPLPLPAPASRLALMPPPRKHAGQRQVFVDDEPYIPIAPLDFKFHH